MTTPHPHAAMITEWIKDTSRQVMCRREGNKNPAAWVLTYPGGFSDTEYRFADNWRNKFRDAIERGEGVEFKDYRGIWSVPPRHEEEPLAFICTEDYYRIKPKPFECWAAVTAPNTGRLYSTKTSAEWWANQYEGGKVIKMREVTEE